MDAPCQTRLFRTAGLQALALAVCGALLAGCVETTASVPPAPAAPADPHRAIARRDGVDPGAASVAVTSLSGVPAPLADRFVAALKREAQAQDVIFSDPKSAKYLLRGYLSARPTPDGTEELAFVWDAFDAKKVRAQRGDDAIPLKAISADPWSAVDDATLTDIAARGASDLAAFLSNTPEALLAAQNAIGQKLQPGDLAQTRAGAPPAGATPETMAVGAALGPGSTPEPQTGAVGVAALR